MAPQTTRLHNCNNTNHGPITRGSNTQQTTCKHGELDPNKRPKRRKTRHINDNKSGKVDNKSGKVNNKRRAGKKTSTAKNAEVAALGASNRQLPRVGHEDSNDCDDDDTDSDTDSNMDSNMASNTDEDDHDIDDHDDHVDDDNNHIGHNNGIAHQY
ncbi:hypothetical protein BYT27DRAFT_7219173 [Phlegmacium glaucopus]|nr:hypothetical protein BYT27DRAFT_7219173 [Phlegmacium glaucopus]